MLSFIANLPPPVTKEQLGARILAQERYEKIQVAVRRTSELHRFLHRAPRMSTERVGMPVVTIIVLNDVLTMFETQLCEK